MSEETFQLYRAVWKYLLVFNVYTNYLVPNDLQRVTNNTKTKDKTSKLTKVIMSVWEKNGGIFLYIVG